MPIVKIDTTRFLVIAIDNNRKPYHKNVTRYSYVPTRNTGLQICGKNENELFSQIHALGTCTADEQTSGDRLFSRTYNSMYNSVSLK